MNIKYVVVSAVRAPQTAHQVCIRRFEDPQDRIRGGEKLPHEFQVLLYGSHEWIAIVLLSPRTVRVLEGIAMVSDADTVLSIVQEIFDTGYFTGQSAAKRQRK